MRSVDIKAGLLCQLMMAYSNHNIEAFTKDRAIMNHTSIKLNYFQVAHIATIINKQLILNTHLLMRITICA